MEVPIYRSMSDITPNHYLRQIAHYKKHLKMYSKLLESSTDEEFKLSLEESIDACFQGIENAQANYDTLIGSANHLH